MTEITPLSTYAKREGITRAWAYKKSKLDVRELPIFAKVDNQYIEVGKQKFVVEVK